MKISLIYCYADKNAGDFAITLGALDILKGCKAEVKVFSKDRKDSIEFEKERKSLVDRYGTIELYESPFTLNRDAGLVKTFVNYFDGLLVFAGIRKRKFRQLLLDSDLIVFNGGNLFRCESFEDFARLCALMYPLRVAHNAKKPFIIFPQSASKINSMGYRLLSPIIRNAKVVFVREGDSYSFLKKKFDLGTTIKQTIDLAFFINNPQTQIQNKKTIALTLRAHSIGDLEKLSEVWVGRILEIVSYIVDEFSSGYKFIIVVQTDKDDDISTTFSKLKGIDIIKTNKVEELLQIYSQVGLLIGMRLHSIILALSVGTPCFGIFKEEWGLKNSGMMKHFEMPYIFIDKTPNNGNIIDQISSLLKDGDMTKSALKEKIEKEKRRFLDVLEPIICK